MMDSQPPDFTLNLNKKNRNYQHNARIILPDENPLDHFAYGIRDHSHFVGRILRWLPHVVALLVLGLLFAEYIALDDNGEFIVPVLLIAWLTFILLNMLVKQMHSAPGILVMVIVLGALSLGWSLIPTETWLRIQKSFALNPLETTLASLILLTLALSTIFSMSHRFHATVLKAYRSRTAFIATVLALSIRISLVIFIGWFVVLMMPYAEQLLNELWLALD